ncbi:DEAD/DEAH box helicase [Methanosphaera sp. ISO3-F5]|uniref:DEAD/DEAH box helicase n=1 Tax=Methanosphaera sp. ISO3-F5 TaxID=1452353 RepID=UPI002B2631DE|nr:DEAD/DEAH box helicase [Methanosphaera sp. ISO3-F5]WQH64900.1 DEAD/DEAH box helicase [Methanosphaera sp. ISO3-F5]
MNNFIEHEYLNKNTIEGRLYQQNLAMSVLKKGNTMIIAPTAMGKTVIAALVSAERLKHNPDSKILILAPSKPLALQHEKSFKTFLNASVASLTGNDKPSDRKQLWNNNQVICATPQTIESDIISREYNFNDVSLIIFDECHHAVGSYSYVYLAQKYVQQAKNQLILGLTASPGWEKSKIKEVSKNIYVNEIIIKSEDDPDVAPYFNQVQTKWIKVKLTPELQEIKDLISETLKMRLKTLKKLGIIDSIAKPSKREVLVEQARLQQKIASASMPKKEYFTGVSILTEVINIMHSQELLETQSIKTLNNYFNKLEKKKTKAAKSLKNDYKFNKAVLLTRKYLEKGIDHPKMIRLIKLIEQLLKQDKNNKIIVFSQFRDTTKTIYENCEKNKIKALRFYGQASRDNDKGLSQKKQIETIDSFKKEDYNVLISTSVAEEGIDIPSVDYVILYEPVPSEIRMIQRKGRTGRKHEGEMFILMTKGTLDESYYWSSQRKERAMRSNVYNSYRKENITLDNHFADKEDIKSYNTQTTDENAEAEIYVDYREKNSNIMRELDKINCKINVKSMTVGDYQITDEIIIERKTVEDFSKSITDKRLYQQAKELVNNCKKPLMIIEGENIYHTFLHPNAIRGALSSIALDFRIPIIQTQNETDTAFMLKRIAIREQEKDNKKPVSVRTQTKPVTLPEQQLFITESLPGIGPVSAKKLLSHFKTVKNLVNASKKELKDVEGIGEKTAKNIIEVTNTEFKE